MADTSGEDKDGFVRPATEDMSGRRALIGLVMVAIGLLLLDNRMGGSGTLLALLGTWWPLIIIAVGVGKLLRLVERPWAFIGPLLVVLLGLILLRYTVDGVDNRLDQIQRALFPIVWPMVLVIAGSWIVLSGATWSRDDATLNEVQLFVWCCGRRLTSCAGRFRRASIVVLAADFQLDLRGTQLHPDGAVVNVTALFGTVDVLLRADQLALVRRPFTLGSGRRGSCAGAVSDKPQLTIHVLGLFGDASATQTAHEPP